MVDYVMPNAPQPDLMGPNSIIKLLPNAAYDTFDPAGLRLWCHLNARYGLPTIELVNWLKQFIAGRSAIEIGSGAGDLAHHLGIKATDSKLQDDPEKSLIYRLTNQPTIRYPSWVEKLDALDAVNKYQPEVVIGCWVTHWIDPEKPPPPGGGNIFGIHEDLLLETGVTYIFIGNLDVHKHKPILAKRHIELDLPFVRSRARNPSQNRILIWN